MVRRTNKFSTNRNKSRKWKISFQWKELARWIKRRWVSHENGFMQYLSTHWIEFYQYKIFKPLRPLRAELWVSKLGPSLKKTTYFSNRILLGNKEKVFEIIHFPEIFFSSAEICFYVKEKIYPPESIFLHFCVSILRKHFWTWKNL